MLETHYVELNKTFKGSKVVVSKIIEVISDATSCPTFKSEMKKKVNNGVLPNEVLDFWFHGDKKELDKKFLKECIKVVLPVDEEGNPRELHRLTCEPELAKPAPIRTIINLEEFFEAKEAWNYNKEEKLSKEEKQKLLFINYFNCIPKQVSANVLSLFEGLGFCRETYKKSKKFALWLHVQPSVNNREIDLKYLVNDGKSGLLNYLLYERDPEENGTKFKYQEMYVFMGEKHTGKSFKKMADDMHPNVEMDPDDLAATKTMYLPGHTTDNMFNRWKGAAIVDEPFSKVCSFEEVKKLYFLLTVRKIFVLSFC